MDMVRVTFYIDGFNFYYGLKKKAGIDKSWKQFYWIDFVKLCEQFLGPDQTIEKVKYFSAAPLNIGKQSRQSALFKANILSNPDKFEIIRGKYYKKTQTCKHCGDIFEVPEEKRTDVNISVTLIGDCLLDNTDILVIITADSDLIPPIEFILKNFPNKKVRIYFPPQYSSYDLKHISPRRPVYLEHNKPRFLNSVMPDTVYNSDKTDSATIPLEWK
ncbi:MAG: NYN domain-containing protein [Clostridiaceae bacterium]|nr:NYN domain-containing protein [Clostridiaceae bacterium]